MFFHHLYYTLKPFIPRWAQIQIRRQVALRKRARYADVWPIDERAAKPPVGWLGWPDGKKFALILMHDVDTENGHQKCLQLMRLDEKMGFRSCFNFVPERYNVSAEVRRILVDRGFEVGVHGLKHDGKLFSSRKTFEKQAVRINHYLKDWKSVGFVSPSMHNNLDWISHLDIKHDCSTFDTDPFEPQPDGVTTIFPFYVPRNSSGSDSALDPLSFNLSPSSSNTEPVTRNSQQHLITCNTATQQHSNTAALSSTQHSTLNTKHSHKGFLELPYTLPQDHTLFVIMKEKNIDIWKKKLDWVAQNGGMALLISHPDYMNFDGEELAMEEYPAAFYEELLNYIINKHNGQYWQALPKEIAHFWKQKMVLRRSP